MNDYIDGLRRAYEGEIIGERLYAELARRDQGERRARMSAVAKVERRTRLTLAPIAARFDITPSEFDIQTTVGRRAAVLETLSWSDFIDKALSDWPPYLDRFAALEAMAPSSDAPAMSLLLRHEELLVEFARMERRQPYSADALAMLEAFGSVAG